MWRWHRVCLRVCAGAAVRRALRDHGRQWQDRWAVRRTTAATSCPTRCEISVRFIRQRECGHALGLNSSRNGMTVNPARHQRGDLRRPQPDVRIMVGPGHPVRGAVYGVAPVFHKTQCFCFDQQVLEPGESAEMPVRFDRRSRPAVPSDRHDHAVLHPVRHHRHGSGRYALASMMPPVRVVDPRRLDRRRHRRA